MSPTDRKGPQPDNPEQTERQSAPGDDSAFAATLPLTPATPARADVDAEDAPTGRSPRTAVHGGAAPTLATLAGEFLGGRYRVGRLLGEGGMGSVYLAFDEILGKEVALKFVRSELASSGGLAELRDEVLLAQKVTHPNVCRTYDLEEIDGRFVVKMEYVAGETLWARITRKRGGDGSGPPSLDETLRIVRAIAEGLAAAHAQGIVHRDLKPNNILVEEGTGRVVLMDFGVARVIARAGGDTGKLEVHGTPAYMAPEQARNARVDGRADLYSLGCVMYQMLVGQIPFNAPTPMAIVLRHASEPPPDARAARPDVPPWIARVVQRLLAKDPDARFASAAALLVALAPPASPWRRLPLIGAVGVALVAALALVWTLAPRPRREWRPQIVERQPAYEENGDTPVISRDGKWLAYPSDRDGEFHLYVEPLDGGGPSRALHSVNGVVHHTSWAPDGQSLIASGIGLDTANAVMRVPFDGGPPTLIAAGASNGEACGDSGVAYVRPFPPAFGETQQIVLRRTDGSDRVIVELARGQLVNTLRCDRAGRSVVYALGQVGLNLSLVPSDLWIASVDGGAQRQLTSDHQSNLYPTFAADGKSVIFASARGGGGMHLWELSLDGGAASEPVQLTSGSSHDCAPCASPDGQRLIYDDDVTVEPVYAHALDGSAPRRVTHTLVSVSSARVTPDGQELIASVGSADRVYVAAYALPGGAERVLADGESALIDSDGREVFYLERGVGTSGGARILAMPRAGGAPRLVAETRLPVAALHAVVDGQVHFTGQLSEHGSVGAFVVPAAGGAPTVEARPPIVAIVPAPRGGWKVVARLGAHAGDMSLRYLSPGVSVDDPSLGVAIPVAAERVVWSPDGRSLLYQRGVELRRLHVEDGSDEPLLTLARYGIIQALSPDGKTVYVAEVTGRVRRLMITNFADRPR